MYTFRLLQKPLSKRIITDGLFSETKNHSPIFNKVDYVGTFKGTIKIKNKAEALEEIFKIFNMQHPRDFASHSMSTGDVIEFTDETGTVSYYMCMSNGFTLVGYQRPKVVSSPDALVDEPSLWFQ